jgi:hypothetical protein
MKRLLIAVLLLALSVPSYSGMIVRGSGGAAPPSKVAVVEYSHDNGDNVYDVWLSGATAWKNTRGQSFTVPSTISLYSIEIVGAVDEGVTGTITMRIGTSSTLTSYIAEVSMEAQANSTELLIHEFVFPTQPTLNSGTTYYFGITCSNNTVEGAFYVYVDTTSPTYANGSARKSSTATWVMGTNLTTADLTFTIYGVSP